MVVGVARPRPKIFVHAPVGTVPHPRYRYMHMQSVSPPIFSLLPASHHHYHPTHLAPQPRHAPLVFRFAPLTHLHLRSGTIGFGGKRV